MIRNCEGLKQQHDFTVIVKDAIVLDSSPLTIYSIIELFWQFSHKHKSTRRGIKHGDDIDDIFNETEKQFWETWMYFRIGMRETYS